MQSVRPIRAVLAGVGGEKKEASVRSGPSKRAAITPASDAEDLERNGEAAKLPALAILLLASSLVGLVVFNYFVKGESVAFFLLKDLVSMLQSSLGCILDLL